MLITFILSSLALAQTNVAATITVDAEGLRAIRAQMADTLSGTETALTAALTNSATTVTVSSTTGIPGTAVIRIDNELLQVSAKTATTFTVMRGAFGTTAAAHDSGAAVKELAFRTESALLKDIVRQQVKQMLARYPSAAYLAQQAAIATARAAQAAELEAAVQ